METELTEEQADEVEALAFEFVKDGNMTDEQAANYFAHYSPSWVMAFIEDKPWFQWDTHAEAVIQHLTEVIDFFEEDDIVPVFDFNINEN